MAHFPEDGANEQRQARGEDEAGAVVGGVPPVRHPELPEDEAELHQVALRVRLLEVQRLLPLWRHAQLLDQRLVLSAHAHRRVVSSLLCGRDSGSSHGQHPVAPSAKLIIDPNSKGLGSISVFQVIHERQPAIAKGANMRRGDQISLVSVPESTNDQCCNQHAHALAVKCAVSLLYATTSRV